MLLKNKFFGMKKSKKGFTLVETMAAIMIFAIVVVGILNAVAFARQMVFTDNVKEKASDKAQLIADEIITTAMGHDPNSTTEPADVISAIALVTNDSSDPQTALIGEVTNVSSFTDPASYVEGTDPEIQYIIAPVSSSATDAVDGTVSLQEVQEAGWNITVRVYYQRINNNDSYDCVEVSAFAPFSYVD